LPFFLSRFRFDIIDVVICRCITPPVAAMITLCLLIIFDDAATISPRLYQRHAIR